MKRVFADTSCFVCLGSSDDEFHQCAVEWFRQCRDTVVTTEYVLVESGNWFSKAKRRQSFSALMDQLPNDPQVSIVPASRDLFARGLELYRRRQDKDWSMTDCISFVVMEDQQITAALSTDHHFEQAGFLVLLK
jgi:hypothetical protein